MAGTERNDNYDPNDVDGCYEKVASQEEIYLESNEEEIRAILIAEVPVAPHESLGQLRCEAVVDLITGDSDDPPLSEEAINDMIKAS